jgi:hypothetical protein
MIRTTVVTYSLTRSSHLQQWCRSTLVGYAGAMMIPQPPKQPPPQQRSSIHPRSFLAGVDGSNTQQHRPQTRNQSSSTNTNEPSPVTTVHPVSTSSFHFASTDYTASFLRGPTTTTTTTPHTNDMMRTQALHYIQHTFDGNFWFKDPVSYIYIYIFWWVDDRVVLVVAASRLVEHHLSKPFLKSMPKIYQF